ncbi:MAG: hypothetical protein F9K18_05135, partial [Thermoanaerobaculia bacterium]
MIRPVEIGLTAVAVAVTEEQPRVLLVRDERGGERALPTGALDATRDRTLELALRALVREQSALELGYLEQLYTFGNRYRDPRERAGGPRVVSVAYLALVREEPPHEARAAAWRAWYDFLPWEDWRDGRPAVLDLTIVPELARWVRNGGARAGSRQRRERADLCFGLGGAPWDGERALDRFELLY